MTKTSTPLTKEQFNCIYGSIKVDLISFKNDIYVFETDHSTDNRLRVWVSDPTMKPRSDLDGNDCTATHVYNLNVDYAELRTIGGVLLEYYDSDFP